jgi:ABC-2 type transport system ATP-binding protein
MIGASMSHFENHTPIQVRGLVKRYGSLTAVGGVDFSVEGGVCLGLLGPNGAGKTTTIEVLEGLLPPDAGEIRVLGMDWDHHGDAIRERIGVQLQETRLPDKLTPSEILKIFRGLYRRGRDPEAVLDLVGLTEKRGSRVVNLSGGQRQRLALGCALVGEPEILFLDEPSTGLDPQARRRVWEIVEEFKGRGGTVLLTTHYMDEAERLADDLVIIDHGKVIAAGSPRSIIDSLGAESIVAFVPDTPVDEAALAALPGVLAVRREKETFELSVGSAHETLPALLQALREGGVGYTDLRTHRPTLEDVFVSLTGRHLRDE